MNERKPGTFAYMSFYWTGVLLSVASFGFAFAGNTEVLGQLRLAGVSPLWITGGLAIGAFLAAEACHSIFSLDKTTVPVVTRETLASEYAEVSS